MLAVTETAALVATEIAVLVYTVGITIMIEKEIEVVDENRIQNMGSEIMILRV